MKFVLVLVAVIACASAAAIVDVSLDQYWNEFKDLHGKVYANEAEESSRRAIWEKNLKFINTHNLEASLGKHTYKVAMNKFGDMTNQEFVNQMNGFNKTKDMVKSTGNPRFLKPSNVKIPDSVDWRTLGYVTPIKDQGKTIDYFILSK
jgi:hypothetical protein